jgi:hypothetical protein
MSPFLAAIDELIRRATTSGTLEDLHRATIQAHQGLSQAPAAEREEAMRRLAHPLPNLHPVPAAKIAITCGALVENGADPHVCGPTLLGLLAANLEGTIRFHELCADKAEADGLLEEKEGENPPQPDELAQKYFGAIHAQDADAAFAYLGNHDVTLAAIAHLARSKQLRAAARARPDMLLNRSLAHERAYGGGHTFLTKMLLMLDDEPLLVLDTDQYRGYRITFSAIPDNFALHTYLMGHLFGDPAEGWIEAVGFDRKPIEYAMTHVCDQNAPPIKGAFNLWSWTGLQPDGTLPKPQSGSEHWIWNEGVPADIVPFEGLRVVILGQHPYARSWRGGLIFSGLRPEFVVQEKLPEGFVKEWLRKLGNAPRPAAAKG